MDREQQLLATARDERWTMERLEKAYILEILEQTGGHRGYAAAILGIDRRTLYRKLKQYADEIGSSRANAVIAQGSAVDCEFHPLSPG